MRLSSTHAKHTFPKRLAARRAAAQLLHRPADVRHPADVAREVAGIQAQDAHAARLAFRARSRRLTSADVDRARTEERSIVRAWAMRGTVHLLAGEDAAWMLPLFEPAVAANSRSRAIALGLPAAKVRRALHEIERALAPGEPLNRGALAERLRRRRIALTPQTRMHLFRLAVAEGIACFGPDRGGEPSLVAAREWLGERPPFERDASLCELARRYLRAFGPATEADFAGWAGLPLRDIRAGLAGIGKELRRVQAGSGQVWALRRAARRPPAAGVVRLLPAWDTYLMGYRDRGFLCSQEEWARIMPGGGLLRPAVLVDGAAAGIWRARRAGKGIVVEVEPFEHLEAATTEAIRAEVADLGRFEGADAVLATS